MTSDEKYAKLLALSIIYNNKTEQDRISQVQRVSCRPEEIPVILNEVYDENFKQWVCSVSHLFKN